MADEDGKIAKPIPHPHDIDQAGKRKPAAGSLRQEAAEKKNMNNPVVWFEIYVDDMARAKAFYETVFDVKLSRLDSPHLEMWAFPTRQDGYGAAGALTHMPGFPAGQNSVLVYFHCADCAVEAAKVVQAGGKIQKEKMSIGPHGHIALVVDSEGNLIGLHSMA